MIECAESRFGSTFMQIQRRIMTRRLLSHGGIKCLPYDIPLRALIAKDVDGLMMAGRCISGDYMHMQAIVSPAMQWQWEKLPAKWRQLPEKHPYAP